MPRAEFFRKFGLFVFESFFDRDLCNQLQSAIRAGNPFAAAVGTWHGTDMVDREFRHVSEVHINAASSTLVKTRLRVLKSELERHFGLTLADCQDPQFLHY